jgi:hypothetical protein
LSTGLLPLLGMLAAVPDARAEGGDIEGGVDLPEPALRGEPEVRGQGFVPRIRNPLKPPRPFDPQPELVVVLEGGPVDPEAQKPPPQPVTWRLVGESFEPPVLPVLVKADIEIRNTGRGAPSLQAMQQPSLLTAEPINPGGVRTIRLDQPFRAVEIRDRESPHLRAHLVAFPHRYFARLDAAGNFAIPDVPAGRWQIRVWYRNGWLKMRPTAVEVTARRTARVRIAIPRKLVVDPPGQDGG